MDNGRLHLSTMGHYVKPDLVQAEALVVEHQDGQSHAEGHTPAHAAGQAGPVVVGHGGFQEQAAGHARPCGAGRWHPPAPSFLREASPDQVRRQHDRVAPVAVPPGDGDGSSERAAGAGADDAGKHAQDPQRSQAIQAAAHIKEQSGPPEGLDPGCSTCVYTYPQRSHSFQGAAQIKGVGWPGSGWAWQEPGHAVTAL